MRIRQYRVAILKIPIKYQCFVVGCFFVSPVPPSQPPSFSMIRKMRTFLMFTISNSTESNKRELLAVKCHHTKPTEFASFPIIPSSLPISSGFTGSGVRSSNSCIVEFLTTRGTLWPSSTLMRFSSFQIKSWQSLKEFDWKKI